MEKTDVLQKNLKDAYEKLLEVKSFPEDEIHRDAGIQRFEFTFEICWKLMQEIAKLNGIETYGPRNSIRAVARLGLVANPEEWLDFLEHRNLTTHVYEQKTAEEVFEKIPDFTSSVKEFITAIENYKI